MHTIDVQGRAVPALGYGTWQLRGAACRDGVAHALSAGYRHVDTAQLYGNEEEVGQALAAAAVPRADVWVTTKLTREHLTPEAVRTSTVESLRRLGLDDVDLLLIHWPGGPVPLEDTLGAMADLVADGLVGAVGVSNFPPSLVRAAQAVTPILANQVEYHAYLSQEDLLDLARATDHVLTAYSPLANGQLLTDPVLAAIADAHGVGVAEVALAWLLGQAHVAAIPKATAAARIEANLAAADLTLSAEERAAIDALDRGPGGRVIDPPFAPDWER